MVHKVFVYGSLKKGFGNHGVIRDGKFISDAETTENRWTMHSMGGFPGVIHGDKRVAGEVYEVDDAGLQRLDWLEGNGHFYNREIVSTTQGDVWMYVLMDESHFLMENKTRVEEVDGVERWTA